MVFDHLDCRSIKEIELSAMVKFWVSVGFVITGSSSILGLYYVSFSTFF